MYKKSKNKSHKETSLLVQQNNMSIKDNNNSKIKKGNFKTICTI